MSHHYVKFDNVHYRYPDGFEALRGVSFLITAMLSRGFSGMFPLSHPRRWHSADTLLVIIWTGAFIAGRLCVIPLLFTHLFNHV